MGGFKVLKGGLLSTVQDDGRMGYQQFGVPVSGVMDFYAYRLANYLVGNTEDEAVIEVTMMGFAVEFLQESVIAIAGGNLTPTVNGQTIKMWEAISVAPGDKLAFQRVKSGCRSYLAFAGGVDVPKVMNSRSTYLPGSFGGHQGRALRKGDEVRIGNVGIRPEKLMKTSLQDQSMEYLGEITLRVVGGPQEEAFTEKGIKNFYNGIYKITLDSDRMGFRLEGAKITHRNKSGIISDGIAMGAIQIPGHGQPILMMADRHTSGGYPKIGNVITADLPKLAQAKPGDTLRFHKISIEEAQEAFVKMEQELNNMKNTLKNLNNSESKNIVISDSDFHNQDKLPMKTNIEVPSSKVEKLKSDQRKFIVRINDKKYTVLVEKRKD